MIANLNVPLTIAPPARVENRPVPSPLRVLVVDDNVVGARLMSRLLQGCGHQMSLAHDGPGAIDAAAAHDPDVILLDIGLPGFDGHEVARRLRKRHAARPVLLVAVTGASQDDDLRRSRESGFDHHLVKPVDPEALIDLLDRHRPARAAG
ncbi:response regulator [Tundrisphaera sp. TA3]|uniref:response regulator n=1 Tax=Tundrisphaera sp. TA3 TaxID=3435775 RepID=UPI003EB97274